jgi:hypothetical protein
MQGFLFSRPVPAEEFGELLNRGHDFALQLTDSMRSLPLPRAVNG